MIILILKIIIDRKNYDIFIICNITYILSNTTTDNAANYMLFS